MAARASARADSAISRLRERLWRRTRVAEGLSFHLAVNFHDGFPRGRERVS